MSESNKIDFLKTEERDLLTQVVRHDTGGYDNWRKAPRTRQFVVDIDARPLAVLANSARYGDRVYEFMSIQRPGDLLHYLWVTLIDVEDEVTQSIKQSLANKSPYTFDTKAPLTDLPFIDFDNCFIRQGDDTDRADAAWRNHIEQEYWHQQLTKLHAIVVGLQGRLRCINDFLLQNEIKLLDEKKHPLDFGVTIKRSCYLEARNLTSSDKYTNLYDTVAQIAAQSDVTSVSCPFNWFAIWRILVEEQVKRSQRLDLTPQEALELSGPDNGFGGDKFAEHWGGFVHIPYEGMCDGDVVFLPNWRVFNADKAGEDGSLAGALRMSLCRYLFVPKDRVLGELACATREEIGDWVLYRQNARMSSAD